MFRYADPAVCPGCRAPIAYGAAQCAACQLPLRGPAPAEVFATLGQVDRLIASLRAQEAVLGRVSEAAAATALPATAPSAPSAGPAGYAGTPAPGGPEAPGVPAAPPVRRPSSIGVPQLLLGLGAVCLLIAALVFLAVAWAALGMGGRTLVLLTLTATAAALAVWVARRGLRGGAEAFATVALGLLSLDVVGANSAGWFGELAEGALSMIVGVVLIAAGAGLAFLGRSTAARGLIAGELAVALGAGLTVSGAVATASEHAAIVLVLGVLGTALLAFVARRLGFTAAWVGLSIVAALTWLSLVGVGLMRALDVRDDTLIDPHTWPLVAAALLAAAPALLPRIPGAARTGGLATAGVLLGLNALLPTFGLSVRAVGIVALVTLAVALIAALPRLPWTGLGLGLFAVGGPTAFVVLAVQSVEATTRLADHGWSQPAIDRLTGWAESAPAWLVLPLIAAVTAVALMLLRHLDVHPSRAALLSGLIALGSTGLAVTFALTPGPRAAVVATLAGGALASWLAYEIGGSDATRPRTGVGAAGIAVVLGLLALGAAAPSQWLTAGVLLVLTALTVVAEQRRRHGGRLLAADLLRGLTMLLAAALVWTAGDLADAPRTWLAALVLVALAVLLMIRIGPFTVTGFAVASVATLFLTHVDGADLTWLAAHLTLLGTVLALAALRHRIEPIGWVGSAVLFLALWVRLVDAEVTTIEAYTLPLAAALIGYGLWRMHTHRLGTLTTLLPGLGVAVGPSLLMALAQPVSLRAALVGLGCAALVALGAGARWRAPLIVGSAAGLLLVLREAAYADVVPQWVLIGVIGVALTVVGVTWEQRLNDLRRVGGYVRRLR